MLTLKELREAAGGLSNLTDEEILTATYPQYRQYYGSLDDYAKAAGYGGAGRGLSGSRISAGIDSYQAGLLGLGGAVSRAVGAEGAAGFFDQRREANEQAAAYAQQRARDLGGIDDWRDVDGVGSGLNYLGGLAAQSLPYLGEAAVGGLAARGLMTGTRAALRGATTVEDATAAARRLAVGQTAGAVGASYPSAVGDILGAQRDAGGEDLAAAALGGIPYSALNALGVEGLVARGFRPLATGQGGLARRMATGGLVTGLTEGAAETGQELINQGFGRMAVDPNETLFNEEANQRYLDSFIGGAALGGALGAVGGIRRPRTVDEGQFDLNAAAPAPAPEPPLINTDNEVGLGIVPPMNPYDVGGFVSRFREGQDTTVGEPQGGLFGGGFGDTGVSAPAPEVTPGTAPATAAPAAPAPATPPTKVYDETDRALMDRGVAPNKLRKDLFTELQAAGLDPDSDVLTGFWQLMGEGKTGKAKSELTKAIAAQNRKAPDVSVPSTPGPGVPGGSDGRSAVAGGSVAAAGPAPAQPVGVGGGAIQSATANGEASLLPGTTAQPNPPVDPFQVTASLESDAPADATAAQTTTAPSPTGERVVSRKKRVVVNPTTAPTGYVAPEDTAAPTPVADDVGDGYANDAEAWDDFRPDDSPTYDELPAPFKEAVATARRQGRMTQSLAQEIADESRDEGGAADDTMQTLAEVFGERDAGILYDTIVGQMPAAEVATKYGVSRGRVAQIAGGSATAQKERATKIAAAQKRLGWTDEYVRSLASQFEGQGDVEVDPTAGRTEVDLEATESAFDADVGADRDPSLREAGFSTADSIGGSVGNWKDTLGRLEGKKLTPADQLKIDKLTERRSAAELAGNDAEVDKVDAELSQLEATYLTPQELAAASTQRAYEFRTKADELVRQIQAARAAGSDFIATKNRKVPITEVEASIAGLEQRVALSLKQAEAILQRGSARTKLGRAPDANAKQSTALVPVGDKPKAGTRVRKQDAQGQAAADQGQAPFFRTPQEQYETLTKGVPGAPAYNIITGRAKTQIDDLARRDQLDLASINRILGDQPAQIADDNVIDVEARVLEETVGKQVAALPAPRVQRLERHYGAKAGTNEFLTKLKEDVVLYATKGADAVAAAIRDIIKTVHAGVLSVAMIFNPLNISPPQPIIIDEQVLTQTRDVRAEVPANAQARMSDSAKEVYSVLYPSIKDQLVSQDKLMLIVDKPSARLFVFKPDGSLLIDKKVLLGAAKGDLYKGNNDVPANRITPAGMFTMGLRDAARGGGEARTAGEYDFGKVFVLDKAIDGEYSVTLFHSVWTKDQDAQQRLNALKNDSAADSRYSFGCINVDKDLYGSLVRNHLSQMDGAALFIVPDNPAATAEFLTGATAQNKSGADSLTRTTFTPKTETTRTVIRTPRNNAGELMVDAQEGMGDRRRPAPTRASISRRRRVGENTTPPELVDRDGGRVLDLVVNGEVKQSFELVSAPLWNAFKGDARDQLLQNRDAVAKSNEAAIALNKANYDYRQTGPLNRVETQVLDDIERGDIEGLTRRASMLQGGMQLRKVVSSLLSHAVYETDQTLDPAEFARQNGLDAALVEQLAPDWMLGRAPRPEQPAPQEMGRTGPAPRMRPGYVPSPKESRTVGAIRASDYSGRAFTAEPADPTDLATNPGIGRAFGLLNQGGMADSINAIQSWYTTNDAVEWDAIFATIDGKPSVVFSQNALNDRATGIISTIHEIGHAVDTDGEFSGQPAFNLRVSDGRVTAMRDNSVIAEVLNYVRTGDDAFTELLQYPLDRTDAGNAALSADRTREEVFAQLWAFSNLPSGMDFLRQNLPVTAAFMETVHEQVKATNYSAQAGAQQNAQPGQVQGGAEAAGDARASRNQARAQEVIGRLPKQAQQPVRTSVSAMGDLANKALDFAVFTSDLVDRAVKAGLTAAQDFGRLVAERAARAREVEREVERIADMYAVVPEAFKGTGPRSVNQLVFDSTREGKWAYGDNADPAMAQRFNAMPAQAQAFIRAVFDHGDQMLARKKAAVLEYTQTEYDARIANETDANAKAELLKEKQTILKRFDRLFKIREGKPYAPIKRFGDYVVIAKSKAYLDAEAAEDRALMSKLEKDEDHYQVSFTDTKTQARLLADRLAKDGRYANSNEGVYLRQRDQHVEQMYGGDGVLRSLSKLRSRIDASDQKGSAQLLRMVSDLYLEALAEDSARKSEMRRRGIAGEVDMLQSFARQGRSDAQFMASVEFNDRIQESLLNMSKQANKARDDGRASEIRNELLARYNQTLEAQATPLTDKITRLSSVYFLATSPAYYLANLTQPFMMSLPAMAGRHGYGSSSAAFSRAYAQLTGVMKSARLFDQGFDFSKVPADVRDAVQQLVNRGKIDIGMETELGEFKIEGDSFFSKAWNRVDKGLRMAVQKVESVNRLSTAMAAYRLELAKTGNKQAALDYADRILTETHGDYTNFNAPRVFNTPIGRIALQFRKFQLIQLSFYAKLIRDAFTNPAERAVALKSLTYALGHTAIFAGVMGMPGYAAIAWLINAALSDDGEKYDLTGELRQAIGDETVANLILRGAPTLVGADLSGKVGAGNMLSIMPFSNADLTTPGGVAQAAGEVLMGAAGGMAVRMMDGVGLMGRGDWYRGLELMVPKGLGDAMKAYRISQEGMTTRRGDVLLPADEVSAVESAMQALGFQPVQQSTTYERRERVRTQDQAFQERSTRIKNDYAKAVRQGDADGKEAARTAWKQLQEARVAKGYQRQPLSELFRAPLLQNKRERETEGGVQFNRANRRFVEAQV